MGKTSGDRRCSMSLPGRQKGSVLLMAGFVLVVLLAFAGIVLDLGQTYVRKSELQNAADAAALAGARELNGSKAGVGLAQDKAIAAAAENKSDFDSTAVAITASNISFGPGPDGPWTAASSVGSDAAAASLYFIRVDTTGIEQGTRPTWVMGAVGEAFASTTTKGYAVAGRTVCEAMPIFACTLSSSPPNYGYTPGQSYLLTTPPAGSPIGPGNIGWMDPAPYGSPSTITGASEMRGILCRGQTMCMSAPGTFTSLTQSALPEMTDALNTRFGIYTGVLKKDEYKQACPADRNVKSYDFNLAADKGGPADWMATPPATQLDVKWSGVRPSDISQVNNYPGTGTPYTQGSGSSYFEAPKSALAVADNRRILTIGLASNCGTINGSGKPVQLVAFAKFLMQVPAFSSGSDKGFYGEFMEMTTSPSVATAEIKLYR